MMLSGRMEAAIQKLYTAFHSDRLVPECSMQCAVGNVCDNLDYWKHFTDTHGSLVLNYVGKVNELFGRKFNGYSPTELLKLEAEFLKGCGYRLPLRSRNNEPKLKPSKEQLFQGLCAAVNYLCKLDHIPDVMNYSRLFDYQTESPSNTPEPMAKVVAI